MANAHTAYQLAGLPFILNILYLSILLRNISIMLSKVFTVALLSAAFAAHAQAASSPLSFRTVKLEAKSCHGKDRDNKPICHESEVAYPVTGDRH